MRLLVPAVLLTLALTACGADPDDAPPLPKETSPSQAALANLTDVCPAVQDALPTGSAGDVTAEEWEGFITTLDELGIGADAETQNALVLLEPGAQEMQQAAEEGGSTDEAEASLSESVQAFSDRCVAAGSDPLQ